MPAGPLTIDSPAALEDGTLFIRSATGFEALGQCFEFTVMVSSSADLNATDLLGTPLAIHLEMTDGGLRHFHGLVAALDFLGTSELANYRIVLRPWLWLLARTANCRIFQNKGVVDIVTAVFQKLDFADFDTSLLTMDNYPPEEYVVQYRETDLDFVCRLLERAGIYFFFQHEANKHTLVLVDAAVVHTSAPGPDAAVPFLSRDAHRAALMEHVEDWHTQSAIVPGVYSHADYDFTKSRVKLFATRTNRPGNAHDGLEVYDYPGGFTDSGVGGTSAQVRLQEDQQPLTHFSGWSNARQLAVGYLFTLSDHPREDQNQSYLLTSAKYRMHGQAAETGGSVSGTHAFDCVFSSIESSRQYRSPSSTPKPVVRGPQTALVVGPSGEEIWTDKYGAHQDPVPLGSRRAVGREELVLGSCLAGLGRGPIGAASTSPVSAKK